MQRSPAFDPAHGISMDAPQFAGAMSRVLRTWLATVAALVVAMIVVGGLTRLTDSGLSITEWQPILGAIPPLTDADWQAAFDKYQTIPQFKTLNSTMGLADFKVIFWWEWAHRFLGRFIGLAMALPFAGFWLAGRLTPPLSLRLLGVTALIGVQGAVGWYMVKSGLADRIDVSPYRLALHLSIAFVILGCLVWLVCDLSPGRPSRLQAADRIGAKVLAALVFAQVALGGLVAGLKAGRAYNTWPLMDGHIIPDGIARLHPWWLNFTENMATVQFDHRLTAYGLVGVALWHAWRVGRAPSVGQAQMTGQTQMTGQAQMTGQTQVTARLLAIGVLSQMTLGIATVLSAVPIGLGSAHQALAAVVFIVAIWHLHSALRSTAHQVSAN